MSFAECQRLFAAVVAAVVCSVVAVDAANAQPHRLQLDNASLFRLTSSESQITPRPSTAEIARAAKLAELPFSTQVENAARRTSLDPALVHALIYVESRHNPAARSPKGALGLMQVLPETASRYGVRDAIRSVDDNLRAGTSYLRDLMYMFDGRIELVLAAYNAGEHAVLRHGERIPPYRETQNYVPAVLAKYRELQATEEPQAPQPTVYMLGTRPDPAVRVMGR